MPSQLLSGDALIARFRAIRKHQRMSLEDLADACGLSRSILANLETGRSKSMSIDQAQAIAGGLGVDLLECMRSEGLVIQRVVV